MNQTDKNNLLKKAQERIQSVRLAIAKAVTKRELRGSQFARDATKMNPGDALAARKLHAHNFETVENLKQLYPSPYFSRCEFLVEGITKHMYFGKFSFGEENIYSWITPAAALRFENPGAAGYKRPDGKIQSGTLLSKDQYLIVDGALKFYATESTSEPRQLVYQENFTTQKGGFILPEVVEKMERAQDQVIRAEFRGPFLITGPAGSGKTTLALHRVAYLMQAPETAEHFTPDVIMVLVQDAKTKAYFSRLLPDLGITNVTIQTFTEWALNILQLEETRGDDAGLYEIDYSYQQAKLLALRSRHHVPHFKNTYAVLSKLYAPYFNKEQVRVFDNQKKSKILDRFDLTLLLQNSKQKNNGLFITKEYYEETAGGSYRKKRGAFPVMFNLAVVDEFQNYLPEQLEIINSCLNPRLQSAVYVGDVAQQTRLGTIRSLSDMTIAIAEERKVKLEKVYRNTKQILEYVRKRGFNVLIPPELKDGPHVIEHACETPREEINFISEILKTKEYETVGILARDKTYLENFKKVFDSLNGVHCLSYQESQGVEFDIVFLVGPDTIKENVVSELQNEINKIEQDLLYIALTRAMREMFVLRT